MLQSFKISALLILFVITNCYSKIIHQSANEFGPIFIEDAVHTRCLSFVPVDESKVRQTCMVRNNPEKLVLSYQKVMLSALYLSSEPPKQVLMLGLGGGTLVTAMMQLLPQAHFDVVEINPAVARIAKEYFNFKENGNTTIFIQDGYEFVVNAKLLDKKYDLIVVDVFSEQYIPPAFLTLNFVQAAKDILSPQGVIAVNTFINHEFSQTELENSLYKEVFGKFWNVEFSGNRVIFSSPDDILGNDSVEKNANIWNGKLEKHGVITKWLLKAFLNGHKITGN